MRRGRRRVQTGADKSAQEECRKGVEVQMACMDLLLILLECIGPCPNAVHHVLAGSAGLRLSAEGCGTLRPGAMAQRE